MPPESRLTKETLVPIGLAITVICAVMGAAMWLQASLLGISSRLDTIQRELGTVSGRVDGTWTRADMVQWVQLLRATNKEMSVPEVPR